MTRGSSHRPLRLLTGHRAVAHGRVHRGQRAGAQGPGSIARTYPCPELAPSSALGHINSHIPPSFSESKARCRLGHEGDNKQWGKLSCDSGILAKICSCCVLNRKKANVVQLGPSSLFPPPPPPPYSVRLGASPPPWRCNGTPAQSQGCRAVAPGGDTGGACAQRPLLAWVSQSQPPHHQPPKTPRGGAKSCQ